MKSSILIMWSFQIRSEKIKFFDYGPSIVATRLSAPKQLVILGAFFIMGLHYCKMPKKILVTFEELYLKNL